MIKKYFKGEFSRNVLTLFTGTSMAQLIPIAISPILTRLYGPEEFGVFALYTAIVSILSVISTGRYELAIILPQKDSEAINISGLAFFLNISISLCLLVVFLIGEEQFKSIFGLDELGVWIYFLPFSIMLLGAYQIIYYWLNRRKMYKYMSTNKVTQQVWIGGSNLSLGYTTNGVGLIFGTIVGQLISLGIIIKKIAKLEKDIVKQVSKEEMIIQAKRYSNFPRYLTFAHTLNISSSNLSTILFTNFFSSVSVGYFSLTQRILRMPLTLIGSSISDVFRQKAVEEIIAKGNCKNIYIKTFCSLFFLASVPFVLLYIISPWLFSFIFGEEWRVAGDYARLMMPMLFFQFITSPLSSLFMIMEKQKLDLIWQIGLFVFTTTGLVIGYIIFNSIEISILLFSIAYSIMYIINGIMTFTFAIHGVSIEK
ncbi:oligosaccharide flippase family protein [Niallia oryzisoli]|uniref:Oligosaccharide flippase family protein n=1 Tax=Niallia oryzisoli TaxID=1737571 RepID=A0ABZ2CFF3_9BACI